MAGKLMHAVLYNKFGGGAAGLKHVEVPIPTPKDDEVLIKVEATALNPLDWTIQKGTARLFWPKKFPFIPATVVAGEVVDVEKGVKNLKAGDEGSLKLDAIDVAGEVVDVGAEVKNFKAGDKVVALLRTADGGGLAEYTVAKESMTVARPPEVSAADGAGLPIAGLTAHEALTKFAGIKLDGSGKQANILVTAASGGVGHYAVQLAKLGNANVTATCGARNIELVKRLGADEVLDYKTPDGAALKSPSGKKYDAVIHCTTGIPWSTFEPNLSANGIVVDLTPGPRTMMTYAIKKLTLSKKQLVPLILIPNSESKSYLSNLVNFVKEGKLTTVIDSKHPLSKAEDAWAKSMDGHATGKIVVEP